MTAGTFIQSTSLLHDTYFKNAVVYIIEYDSKGAVGFIVNRPFARKLNELVEFKHGIPFPLYEGGPVGTEQVFFIHRRPDIIPAGQLVADDVYMGGDFTIAVRHINNATATAKHIKLFIGYCGWDYGELDEEIKEGSWVALPLQPSALAFNTLW